MARKVVCVSARLRADRGVCTLPASLRSDTRCVCCANGGVCVL